MAKPLSEHTTTIKAKKAQATDDEPMPERRDSGTLAGVGGGRVKRIVFEGREPRFEEVEEGGERREWRPRHRASMEDIHFEVDHINRWQRSRGSPSDEFKSRTLYRTEGGGVSETVRETERGTKRTLYTSRRKGDHDEETRFSEAAVDRLIATRGPREEAETTVRRRVTKKTTVTKGGKTTTTTSVEESTSPKAKKAKKPKKAKKAKAAKKAEPEPKVDKAAVKSDYQPQCGAVTNGGKQCRNSSKSGSKYCGAHQGHKPKKLEDVLDTVPKRASDTAPGSGDEGGIGQCAAYTSAGLQCKNHSRKGSKYCGKHKGYRAPSKAQLAARLDTKPRHKGAKDTEPSLK